MLLYIMFAYLMLPTALFNGVCIMLIFLHIYIFLYIMLAYLMLLTALLNAVCSHNLPLTFSNDLCFHALS